jgi:hypothetical protein
MIKFFRKIRQRFLSEGKFSKYLIYAIGEIVLVVIGILIALQINTRNKEHQEQHLETKILQEMKSNLSSDRLGLEADIALMDSLEYACQYASDHIINQAELNTRFSYALNHLRITPHFDPNSSGYELLVSKGLELIRTDSLRRLISELYETQYPYYSRYENERIDYVAQNVEPRLLEYVSFKWSPETYLKGTTTLSDTDHEKLMNDDGFMKLIAGVSVENHYVKSRAQSTLDMVNKLDQLIETELKEKNR